MAPIVKQPTILTIPSSPLFACMTPLQTTYFSALESALNNSTKSIQICQYVFSATGSRAWQRSEKIFNAIIRAKERGVTVSILLDGPKPRSPNALANIKTARRLSAAGIASNCLTLRTTLHLKLIIIDSSGLFTGSHNLTNSSLYSPLELSFLTTDQNLVHAAEIFFASLWLSPMLKPFPSSKTQQRQIEGPG